jgi:hypothetical protein
MTVRLYLRRGSLFGYRAADLARNRRKLLVNVIKKGLASYATLIRRLNVLSIYNKNKNPSLQATVKKDMQYLRRFFKKGPYAKRPVRRKRKTVRRNKRKTVRKTKRQPRKKRR